MKSLTIAFCLLMMLSLTSVAAQQGSEQRSAISANAVATDARGRPAIEARLLTTVLVGSPDSPVTNASIVLKNISGNAYSYVTGWAMFYNANGVRCGEGLFKVDALDADESAEIDTPGLRLRCTPATWKILASSLLTTTGDAAKVVETAPAVETVDRPALINFIISIDGEDHPIQVNNPVVLRLGNRDRKIVLRAVP